MSYIVQRNQRFYVVAYNGHDPITGRERRRWHTAGSNPDDAEAVRHRIDRQRPIPSCEASLGGFMSTTWLGTKRTLTRPTANRYRWMIDHNISPRLGTIRLDALRPEDLDACYLDLMANGGRRRQGLSPKSVLEVHRVICNARPRRRPPTHRHQPCPPGTTPETGGPIERASDLERPTARPIPRSREWGAVVSGVASRRSHRDATRRGRRPELGRSRRRRRESVDRAVTPVDDGSHRRRPREDPHQPPPDRSRCQHRRSARALGATPRLGGCDDRAVEVAFSAILARPASTAPIVDADGERVPGSIAELGTVAVNGHDLHVMIRGHNVDNPVLLFLAGGPGGSEMGAMRNHLPGLEEHFTVVTWDQRGTGKSYDELDPADTYTLDSAVADTVTVTNHLRERFGQDRIYLLGQSWGTTLGILAVQQHPKLYRAFIGTGQMVSQLATDTIFYDDTLAWARANGDNSLVDDLLAIGPPPYDRMLDYETALSSEHDVYPYDHSPNSEGEGGFSENFLVPEYTLIDQIHLLGAFMDTFSVLYPQLQNIDFRRTATDFDIPMFFVQGAHEADGRAEPFADWYPMTSAPTKDLTFLDTSGHRPLWEQPDEFVHYMVTTVLAQTAH